MQIYIYGAKALALGACVAVRELYPQHDVTGFLVKSLHNNPTTLAGLPVYRLCDVKEKDRHILIAAPEDVQEEIVRDLRKYGFFHYTCMDSGKEARLMERYYTAIGRFPSIHAMPAGGDAPDVRAFMAKSGRDRELKRSYDLPEWICPLHVGAASGKKESFPYADDTGENISKKNGNYCELTALYWMWKNQTKDAYYGLFHYRRMLDLHTEDLKRLKENDIDVVLPFPTVHEPDILEHHSRYVKESDWEAMRQALLELCPEYEEAFSFVLSQPYLYNYNMLLAKRKALDDYCKWLFPILERTEELSVPKGEERSDRYIGYLGENLMTLYFLCNRHDLNIAHTGRTMLV